MAKSRSSAFFKQQSIMDNAFKIAKQAKWEDKHGKQNLSITEKLILDAQQRKASKAKQPKQQEEKPRFSPAVFAQEWVKQNR